jgi:hypothetical protein
VEEDEENAIREPEPSKLSIRKSPFQKNSVVTSIPKQLSQIQEMDEIESSPVKGSDSISEEEKESPKYLHTRKLDMSLRQINDLNV